jgi:outer membrane protein OmpA-like peptidoglycan-associated protein
MPEGYFSRYLSPRLDLLLKGNLGIWNSSNKSSMDLAYPSLNLRLKLSGEERKFRPYLYAGGGLLADNSDFGASFDVGFGGKYYFKPNAALYFDAGYINGIDAVVKGKDVHDNIWKVTAGIEVDFGKIKDADMDGVSDKKDKCPGTPAGVTVDEAGCPVDTDGDGVADYIDDCPSVAGLNSLKGCPDTDKDGIADKDDACPDVAGLINLKGCPDADGDGITDKSDKCPNTKKGYKVDSTGCPFDKDKDGIIDEEDGCPTVAGPIENKGCPIPAPVPVVVKEVTPEQVIMQNIAVPSVHFVSDKSYLTDYSKGILDKLVITLNKDVNFNVNMYGYTDSQGSDEYNIKLSKARTESVANYLISKGISKDRILKQKALGKSKPIASNKTEEGRLQNRRVEFEIFKMK